MVIDTQVDFADGGASPVAGTTQVRPTITQLLDAYRDVGLPIVHMVRLYQDGDVDLPRRARIAAGAALVHPGSAGSQIVPALRPGEAPDLEPDVLLKGQAQQLAARFAALILGWRIRSSVTW